MSKEDIALLCRSTFAVVALLAALTFLALVVVDIAGVYTASWRVMATLFCAYFATGFCWKHLKGETT